MPAGGHGRAGMNGMDNLITEAFSNLDRLLRPSSVAQIGGFRPLDFSIASWFGGTGVGLPGESLPTFQGERMFPLLQVNVTELPYVPPQLEKAKLFVVFLNPSEIPFGKPHGEGWLIQEYDALDLLVPLPPPSETPLVRPFPIKWHLHTNDPPGWETAGSLIDMSVLYESAEAEKLFFEKYQGIPDTKIGGYPYEIQHGNFGKNEFVFQIGSEEKPRWMWADNGIGYFLKDTQGNWKFECQFY